MKNELRIGFLCIIVAVFILTVICSPSYTISPSIITEPIQNTGIEEDLATFEEVLIEEAVVKDEFFYQLLSSVGLSEDDISASQLLIVKPNNTEAVVYCYEHINDTWTEHGEPILSHVGRNGVSNDKTEGDGTTPIGLFPLGHAFGIEEKPSTEMEYRQVTSDSYWVDDSNSQFYNQWVEGAEDKDWNSAEHLADYPTQYALAIVIEYNMNPITPMKGSAIFFHCGDTSTAGCVSVSRENMLNILEWLNPLYQPSILICPNSE